MQSEAQVREYAKENNLTVVDNRNIVELRKVFKKSIADYEEYTKINDPETEPYRSKYKARTKCIEARQTLLSQQVVATVNGGFSPAEIDELKDYVAHLDSRIGSICIEVEEPHEASTYLDDALTRYLPDLQQFIESKLSKSPETDDSSKSCGSTELLEQLPADLALRTDLADLIELLNNLAALWCNREQFVRSLAYLETSTRLYSENATLIHDEKKTQRADSTYTYTLFYLAQVWGHLKNAEKSSFYCIETLKRQVVEENFDKLEWIRNARQLAEYFISTMYFQQAAHNLTACGKVYETITFDKEDEENVLVLKASVEETWGKLYLTVLKVAKELSNHSNQVPTIPHMNTLSDCFTSLNIHEVDHVDPSTIDSFEKAREVFKAGHNYLLRAKEYFVLDGFVTEHIRILQDISSLYKYLAWFETDLKRQIAMHLRRTALLSTIPDELNPSIYGGLMKELTFELGETYNEISVLKEAQLESKGKLKPSDITKYNEYAQSAIKFFQLFTKQYYIDSKLPDAIDVDELGPFLRAQFYVSRLFGRLLFPQEKFAIPSLTESLNHYEETLRLASKYMSKLSEEQRAQVHFDQELNLCREMTELLPQKISRIHCG